MTNYGADDNSIVEMMKNPDVPGGSLEGLYIKLVETNQIISKHIEVRKELLQAIAQTEESFSYKKDAEIHNFEQYIRNEFPDPSSHANPKF